MQITLGWRIDPPFAITPASITLPAGESAQFEVSFKPDDASSFSASACCQLSSGESIVTTVSQLQHTKSITVTRGQSQSFNSIKMDPGALWSPSLSSSGVE